MIKKTHTKKKYFYTASTLLTCYGFLLLVGTMASISLHTKIKDRKNHTNINNSQDAVGLDQNLDQKNPHNTRIISIELPTEEKGLSNQKDTKEQKVADIAKNNTDNLTAEEKSNTNTKPSNNVPTENKKSVVNGVSKDKTNKTIVEKVKQNKPIAHKESAADKETSDKIEKEKSNPLGKIVKWASAPQFPRMPKMPWDTKRENKEQKPVLKERHKPSTKNVARKESPTKEGHPKKMLARVTVYWAYGSGTDKWSAKKQSSTGTRLECGQHAAVDPKVIPYGSKLEVQKYGKEVVVKAVDTGSAVKKRKAAIAMAKNEQQRKAPVIDLFFERKSDALHYAKNNPAYQWVEVHP